VKFIYNKLLSYILVFYSLLAILLLKYLNLGISHAFGVFIFVGALIYLSESIKSNIKFIIPKYLYFLLFFTIYSTLSDILLLKIDITLKYFLTNGLFPLSFFLFIIENLGKLKTTDYRLFLICIFVIVCLSAVVSLIQSFNPFFLLNPDFIKWYGLQTSLFQFRLPSIYSWISPNAVGFVLIAYTSILLSEYLKAKKNIIYFIILLVSSFIVAFLLKARWVLINYILLFSMFFIYKKFGIKNLINYILILLIVSFFSFKLLNHYSVNIHAIVTERMLEEGKGGLAEGSASTRLLAFNVFFKLFPERPLFGVGASITEELSKLLEGRSSQIHVGYLSLFYYYGLVGGIIYLLFIYYFTKRLYRHAKFHHYWGPFYGWIGFILANFTLVYLVPWDPGLMLCIFFDRYYLIKKIESLKVNRIL
jgi:hypothetical protein